MSTTKSNAKKSSINEASTKLLPKQSAKDRLDLLKQMLLIRRFEEKAGQAFQLKKILGFCHLYIGQEALAVGTISVLNPHDGVITAYRDHGHALARGMCPNACMAELFGKATGCSRGKGGSMHFFDAKRHFYGGHGIVGGQTPLGLGIAFSQKYKGDGGVTLCYLGDGAVNQGPFHEALNLAALWKLPVIYIVENNEWSMGTSLSRSSAGLPLVNRAQAYDMAGIVANGMDVDDVRAKTAEAVHLARTESQPTLMDIKTYRYRGHSMSDPGTYRTKDEIEKYKQYDPILTYRSRLMDEGILDNPTFDQLDAEAQKIAQESYDFAEKSPEPNPEEVWEDIFTPEDQVPPLEHPTRYHR
jgi:pyruvate dehydrogenase E1 component alpha subunit